MSQIQSDMLFKALTRPPSIMGIPYTQALMSCAIPVIGFILMDDLRVILLAIPLLATLYILNMQDAALIDATMIKLSRLNICRNKMFYGGNSYDCA